MRSKDLFLIVGAGILVLSCSGDEEQNIPDLNFREEMRTFVQDISAYAKDIDSDFLIIPQNGQEILTTNSEADGPIATSYVNAIDAVGREDLFYGYTADNTATPANDNEFLIKFCDVAKNNGKTVLVTDYCSSSVKVDDSYSKNKDHGYISFAADHRELDNIPVYPGSPNNKNNTDVSDISDVKNFLYLINTEGYNTKQLFLDAIKATDYDLVLIDLDFSNDVILTASDVTSLKTKAGGGSRLVICYMSIGEAEDYRYYWETLDRDLVYKPNPDWPGNYVVKYWEPSWKSVIYGNDQSYISKIINAGFDGVYLDIIEGYEYFE